MGTLSDVLRAVAGQIQIHSPLGRFLAQSAQTTDDLVQSVSAPRLAPGLFACPSSVTVGDAVYVSGSNAADRANAVAAVTVPAVGIVVDKPTPTSASVVYSGEASVFSGLVPGGTYYVSWGNPGKITGAVTGVPGQYKQQVGVAKNSTTLIIEIGEAFLLSGI